MRLNDPPPAASAGAEAARADGALLPLPTRRDRLPDAWPPCRPVLAPSEPDDSS